MIIETIVTTTNEDGTINVAPMGPHIENGFSRFELKPFNSSTTFQNLVRTRQGVIHLTDDAMLFAKAAIGRLAANKMEFSSSEQISGAVISRSMSWFEFEVDFIEEVSNRATMKCRAVKKGSGKAWRGFNRARHAVLEAAILATRVSFLPIEEIAEQYARLETIVRKTGGTDEQSAFELLKTYVDEFSTSKS